MCLAQVKWHAHVSLVVPLWWSSRLNFCLLLLSELHFPEFLPNCLAYQPTVTSELTPTKCRVNSPLHQLPPLFTTSSLQQICFPKYLSCLPDLTLTDIPTSNTLTYELGEKTWHLWKLRIFSKKVCFSITLNISVLNYSPSPTISLDFSVGDLWAAVNEYWLLKSSWNKYSTPGFRALMGGVSHWSVIVFHNQSSRLSLRIKQKKEFYLHQYCYFPNFPERVVQKNTNAMKIGPSETQNS